jgi:hypothetical protein
MVYHLVYHIVYHRRLPPLFPPCIEPLKNPLGGDPPPCYALVGQEPPGTASREQKAEEFREVYLK